MKMKNLKSQISIVCLIALLIVGFSSCSNDGEDSSNSSEFFTFVYEGEAITITSWEGIKVENTIGVIGTADNGINIALEFNKFGNLGYAAVYSTQDPNFEYSESYNYYKSYFFNFELLSFDEDNKRVEVNFSGDLYEDEYDITSATHDVEGNFNVSYTESNFPIEGVGLYAKINGVDWYQSDSDQTGGFLSGSNVYLNNFNDGPYTFSIEVNHDLSVPGSYNFDGSSTVNRVLFYEFDPITHQDIAYETVGTFVLSEKEVSSLITVISGSFNFVATNPITNNTITITNGLYKEVYNNY